MDVNTGGAVLFFIGVILLFTLGWYVADRLEERDE